MNGLVHTSFQAPCRTLAGTSALLPRQLTGRVPVQALQAAQAARPGSLAERRASNSTAGPSHYTPPARRLRAHRAQSPVETYHFDSSSHSSASSAAQAYGIAPAAAPAVRLASLPDRPGVPPHDILSRPGQVLRGAPGCLGLAPLLDPLKHSLTSAPEQVVEPGPCQLHGSPIHAHQDPPEMQHQLGKQQQQQEHSKAESFKRQEAGSKDGQQQQQQRRRRRGRRKGSDHAAAAAAAGTREGVGDASMQEHEPQHHLQQNHGQQVRREQQGKEQRSRQAKHGLEEPSAGSQASSSAAAAPPSASAALAASRAAAPRATATGAAGGGPDPDGTLDFAAQLLRQQASMTRRISCCSCWQEVRQLLDLWEGSLNHVHLIAMINQLDKLTKTSQRPHQQQQQQRNWRQQLQHQQQLRQGAGLGQRQQQPAAALVQRHASNGQGQGPQCLPAGWRAATGSRREVVEYQKLVALLLRMAGRALPLLSPRELPVLLAATARLGLHPGKGWVTRVMAHAYPRLNRFTPQGLATTVWALGQLGMHLKAGPNRSGPGAAWARRCLDVFQGDMMRDRADGRALSVMLHGLATTGCRPPGPWLDQWAAAVVGRVGQLSSRDVSCCLWAMVALRRQGSATGGRLRWGPPAELLSACLARLVVLGQASKDLEISNSVWGLAQLSHAADPVKVQQLLALTQPRLATMAPRRLVTLLYGLARWQVAVAVPWREAFLWHSAQHLWALDEQGLANLLYALALLRWPVPEVWQRGYVEALGRQAYRMGPRAWHMIHVARRLLGWQLQLGPEEQQGLGWGRQQQQQQVGSKCQQQVQDRVVDGASERAQLEAELQRGIAGYVPGVEPPGTYQLQTAVKRDIVQFGPGARPALAGKPLRTGRVYQ